MLRRWMMLPAICLLCTSLGFSPTTSRIGSIFDQTDEFMVAVDTHLDWYNAHGWGYGPYQTYSEAWNHNYKVREADAYDHTYAIVFGSIAGIVGAGVANVVSDTIAIGVASRIPGAGAGTQRFLNGSIGATIAGGIGAAGIY